MKQTTLEVRSPYDNTLLGEVPLRSIEDISAAIERAANFFGNSRNWLTPNRRIDILEKSALLIEQRLEEFVRCAASEGGKPYTDSKAEVQRAINGLRGAAHCLESFAGEQIPMGLTPATEGRIAFTQREPIGLVASISAFNHPLNLAVHQTAPAIAVGAPVLIKPAQATPLSCLKLMEVYHEAGLPEALGTALVTKREGASLLTSDPRIAYLSFIGSGEVGWHLRSQLAKGTRCGLEHGGVAPVIVFEDADIKTMLPQLLKGGFYHAGQVCVSVQCVYAPKKLTRKIAQELGEQARKLVVGDPLDPKTEVGPIISIKELERIESWVTEAREGGAELICGGARHGETCYQPTVLLNPPAEAKVSSHEVFGPVVCVFEYEDPELVLQEINASPYGFQAALYTKNIDTALSFGKRIDATTVMINDHTAFRADWMPFGGRNESGLGMGGIPYSMHEMSREKMLVFHSPHL